MTKQSIYILDAMTNQKLDEMFDNGATHKTMVQYLIDNNWTSEGADKVVTRFIDIRHEVAWDKFL